MILGVAAFVLVFGFSPVEIAIKRIVLAAGFAVIIGLANAYPIQISEKVQTNVSSAALFAAILILQPVMAVIAAIVGSVASEVFRRRPCQQVLFNAAVVSVYVGVASITYSILVPSSTLAFNTVPSALGPVVVALLIYTINRVLVAGVAGIQLGKNPISLWRQAWKEDLIQEVTLFASGLLVALAVNQVPWSILLLVIPAAIVYRSFARITELNLKVKAQMEELSSAQGQLVETAKMAAIGTLSAGIAHQINNPIFAIRGRAEQLLATAETHLKSAKAKENLDTIYRMADRVSKVIKSLLTSSRPSEDGRKCAAINEILDNVRTLLKSKAKESRIRVLCDYRKQLPLVCGEGTEIQELFMNLTLNSCDSMPTGGELRLRARAKDSFVCAEISDTGEGIHPDNLSKIFDPFFTTKEVGKGVGLGLFVVREIARRHGGNVSVQSELGKGSTFTVSLPIAAGVESRQRAMAMASDNGSPLPLRSR